MIALAPCSRAASRTSSMPITAPTIEAPAAERGRDLSVVRSAGEARPGPGLGLRRRAARDRLVHRGLLTAVVDRHGREGVTAGLELAGLHRHGEAALGGLRHPLAVERHGHALDPRG